MSTWTVLYGGELSKDVAQRLVEGALATAVRELFTPAAPAGCLGRRRSAGAWRAGWRNGTGAKEQSMELTAVDMEGFKKLRIDSEETKIIFILQVSARLFSARV
jgi:hypothetical protein